MENQSNSGNGNYAYSITIIGVLFFIFGFITWLNSTLIPFLKISCELKSNVETYLVTFAFYIAYFIMAIPSSIILKKTGFKNGMALGLIVMAAGSLIFIPAAYTRTFGLFLTGLFVQATGLTLLQTASNPYVTVLGPIESAAKRISIMGICNKIAGSASPIILGTILFTGTHQLVKNLEKASGIEKELILNSLAKRVVMPYLVIALLFTALAFILKFLKLPEINSEPERNVAHTDEPKSTIMQYPQLVLGVIALFLYVGVEVIAADTIISYGQSHGFPLEKAKLFASTTLICMVIGYILGIFLIPKYLKQEKALAFSAVLGVVFTISALLLHSWVSILFIAVLGLANAIMWPAIWPLALHGLGKFIKTGSAMLIMAILGGALFPLLYGYMADMPEVGKQSAYWILIPAYLFILHYSIKGHKYKKW
jgi:MFS transporter, FHS family, L-fucose permease